MSLRRHWPYLFFCLLLVGIFYRALFFGAVLGGHHDRLDAMLPLYALYSRAFRAGEVPLWNPYIFCGKSTMGCGMFVFFYPLYWLAFAGPEAWLAASTTFILIAHVAIALVGSFLLFRRLGADRFWATVATLSYVLSASIALQIATEATFPTYAYLPLLLWLIAGQTTRPRLTNLTAQAAIYVLILLSGLVQLVLYAVAVSVAFAVYRAIRKSDRGWRFDVRRASASGAPLALGILVAAVRWIPFFFAQRAEGGALPTYKAFENASHMVVTDLLRFVMPEFFGTDAYESFFGQINHYESFGGCPGVLGAWIMLASLFSPWRRRTTFWNLLFIVMVLTALGTPFTYLHYIATGRSLLHYSRVAWLLPLPCAALVAVRGREIFTSPGRWTYPSLAAFGAAWLLLARLAYQTRLPGYAKIILGDTIRDSVGQFVLVLAAVALLLPLARRVGEGSRTFRSALLLLVTLDLMLVFTTETNISKPFMTAPSSLAYPQVDRDAVAALGAVRMFRVLRPPKKRVTRSWADFTTNDRWIALGAYSSSGYDNGAPSNIVDLYTYFNPPNRIFRRVVVPSTLHVAELSSTRIVVDHAGLHELDDAVPRVRLFTRYTVADDAATTHALLDPKFDPNSQLFVHEQPGFPSDDGAPAGSVDLARDDLSEVDVHTQAGRPALLLLNDTYDEGWRAEIDGVPTQIMRANYAFRAVEVPVGEHTVRWRYTQRGYHLALFVSGTGTLALALLAAGSALRRRPRPRLSERGHTLHADRASLC